MKILELCNYSAGICGVWNRVKEESERLSKLGHEVKIFSSNLEKGTNKIVSEDDIIGDVLIRRFSARRLGGESFMLWNFEEEALKFKPDVIIAHSYRHIHTGKALKIAKKIGCRVFLVTHAPFERGETRKLLDKFIVHLYDKFIGKRRLKEFDKIIAITRWEYPYLKKLGVSDNKIIYIPNGIPSKFFEIKNGKEEKNKLLFLGRIAEVKDIETLILAMNFVDNCFLEIVGPAEEKYLLKLKKLIRTNNLERKIKFSPAVFDLKEKIKKIDKSNIFVLPSKSEGMSQALIEAMARGKIVIASNNPGNRDLIVHGENGFLLKAGSYRKLADKINYALSADLNKMKNEAKKSVKYFSWSKIIEKIDNTIES